jgi:hypothetical protein
MDRPRIAMGRFAVTFDRLRFTTDGRRDITHRDDW